MLIYPFFLLILDPLKFIHHKYDLIDAAKYVIHTNVILLLCDIVSKLFSYDLYNLNFKNKE